MFLSHLFHLLIESHVKVLIFKRDFVEIAFLVDVKGVELTLISQHLHRLACLI